MRPERAAALVLWWVRFYTRNLPPAVAARRIEELAADLHDHIGHERARGASDMRIALALVARMARGMPADASWRRHAIVRAPNRKGAMPRNAYRNVAIATAGILMVPLIAMLLTNGASWGVFDFVFAGVLVGGAGLLLAQAVHQGTTLVHVAVAVVVGLAAMVLGESDDAPGLFGFGCLLIVGTVAMRVRTARRSG
jgi:hypothetical protein